MSMSEGQRVGKYEIVRPLAVGGMAQLYLARTTGIGAFERYVVVKIIMREKATDKTAINMFLDEARLATSLHHNNVAQVIEVGIEDELHFFVMEYVHGQDLRAILGRCGELQRRIPLEVGLFVVASAAAGLHHAHERRSGDGTPLQIVHRDVSPSNVMVAYDGGVKMVDFGIAKASERSAETQAGTIKGKFAYMSPEQCRGRDIDRRSDVFALGIVLYEVTTQQRAFRADSDFETMQRIVNGTVRRPTSLVPGYPRALEAIVLKALSVQPDMRYQSAGELMNAIEDFALQSGLRLSASVLTRFMQDLYGDVSEPWVSAAPRAVALENGRTEYTVSDADAKPPVSASSVAGTSDVLPSLSTTSTGATLPKHPLKPQAIPQSAAAQASKHTAKASDSGFDFDGATIPVGPEHRKPVDDAIDMEMQTNQNLGDDDGDTILGGDPHDLAPIATRVEPVRIIPSIIPSMPAPTNAAANRRLSNPGIPIPAVSNSGARAVDAKVRSQTMLDSVPPPATSSQSLRAIPAVPAAPPPVAPNANIRAKSTAESEHEHADLADDDDTNFDFGNSFGRSNVSRSAPAHPGVATGNIATPPNQSGVPTAILSPVATIPNPMPNPASFASSSPIADAIASTVEPPSGPISLEDLMQRRAPSVMPTGSPSSVPAVRESAVMGSLSSIRPSPKLAVAAAGIGLLVLVLAIWLFTSGDSKKPESSTESTPAVTQAPANNGAESNKPSTTTSPEKSPEAATQVSPPPVKVAPAAVSVTLRSEPAANVFSEGKKLGTTPIDIKVLPDARMQVVLEAKGYEKEEVELTADKTQLTVKLNAVAKPKEDKPSTSTKPIKSSRDAKPKDSKPQKPAKVDYCKPPHFDALKCDD